MQISSLYVFLLGINVRQIWRVDIRSIASGRILSNFHAALTNRELSSIEEPFNREKLELLQIMM